MSRIRTVFLGTPEFARYSLEKLHGDQRFEIVGVVSQPDRPAGRKMKLQPSAVKAFALENNLAVLTPEKISDPGVMDTIKSWDAEVAVVVAFGQILPQSFLDVYPGKVVNVHGSLLPLWRGAAPIQRSLMAGDKETGVALQVMVKKLDAGDVIGVRKIELTSHMDALILHDRLKELGAELLATDFLDYLKGNLAPTPQDEARVTIAPKIDKSEGQIDWSKPASEIFNRLRGLKMGPGSYTTVGGKKLKIHQVLPQEAGSQKAPGEIIEVSADGVLVACGQGALKVLEVQPESRARMLIGDYLKGYATEPGDRWGE